MIAITPMSAPASDKPAPNPSKPEPSAPQRETPVDSEPGDSEPDEDEGLSDPFLQDGLPEPSDPDDPDEMGTAAIFVPEEPLLDPRDLSSSDEDRLGPDQAEGFSFRDGEGASDDDDEQGPPGEMKWQTLDASEDPEQDDAADGPLESLVSQLEQFQPLKSEDDSDDIPFSAGMSELLVDDADIPWSHQRWTEMVLPATYSALQGLALVGGILCITGEQTQLLSARDLGSVEECPLHAKLRRAFYLDADARRLLLLTTTGQLLLWQRNLSAGDQLQRLRLSSEGVVSLVWQLAPGVPQLLFKLETGQLLAWNDDQGLPVPVSSHAGRLQMRALSELGEPRVSLWQGSSELLLKAEIGPDIREMALTPSMTQAALSARPLLSGFVEYAIFAARDHGLFIHRPSQSNFERVPGCRQVTAIAAGLVHERPTAFVGLFSELDDRAEIVTVDLESGRACRVIELTIHSDNDGPADDPPERARIDALLWDPLQSRLWAAGCFGLACFHPPESKATSAARRNSDQ
ncbi:MAG: hypothetical protein ACM3ZE_12105 [Myxococcales bacterium]